jgi:hypothetical protein
MPSSDGVGLMRTIQECYASNIARLQHAEMLLVAIAHDLVVVIRMVQADRMSYLMRDGVADVIDLQIAVKADFPTPKGVETDQRLRDGLDHLCRLGIVGNITECPALRFTLGANDDVGVLRELGLAKINVGSGLPHSKCGGDLPPDNLVGEQRSGLEVIESAKLPTIAGAINLQRFPQNGVRNYRCLSRMRASPMDSAAPKFEEGEITGVCSQARNRVRTTHEADERTKNADLQGFPQD